MHDHFLMNERSVPNLKLMPMLMPMLMLAACLSELAAAEPAAPATDPIRFNRDIRPIIAESCFHCHGPDPGSRKAGLRFDREESFFAAREGEEPTVIRGKPEASPLYRRITSDDPDEIMPPTKAHKPLKPEERESIRRWIAEGAHWEPHWSLIPPERPALPKVADSAWAKTPIDRFVLAKLEAAGLAPAPEADRRALARRVSLDLTGLPPEPAAVDAFVADRLPGAYEKLVDALLASPRYGEHRARYWLDAARYADTHGLHFDNYREMWAYRDWVIAAFNADMPFDRFTIEQIAGDLLPNPTRENRIATGFHRCGMTTNEGGTIEAENLAIYARERVETTSWVWLGLTANCAVCHDHKFDPIPTKDFYAFSAFFRNTVQGALDGNVKNTAPVVALPANPEDELRMSTVELDIAKANTDLAERKKALSVDLDAWVASLTIESWSAPIAAIGAPALHLPLDAATPDGSIAGEARGAAVVAHATTPVTAWEDGIVGKAAVLHSADDIVVDGVADLGKDQAYSFGCWVKIPKDGSGYGSIFSRMDEGDDHKGWDLWMQGDQFCTHLIHHWPDDALKVSSRGGLKRDTWQHVFVTYDGSGKSTGMSIFIDGVRSGTTADTETLKTHSLTGAPFKLARRKNGEGQTAILLQDLRLYTCRLEDDVVRRLASSARLGVLLAKPVAERTQPERDELLTMRCADDEAMRAASARLAALESERAALTARSPVTHVMEERKDTSPVAFVLTRGQYDQPGEKVDAGVFTALHAMPKDAPHNRMGLALWLVAPENPLTARVTVNRFWQELFGTGLVKTSEDFGIMGDPPSHPELLDHLAVEFRAGGWKIKPLIRSMVLSATYRQAAVATPEKIEKDPANRLLSRGPRFRMDAEMVRDFALCAAGALSPMIGGPSVKPYQPEGVWESIGMQESDTHHYKQDAGEALYRRSMYTFWKRQAPPASLEVLNAPSREVSCLRRERTDTPLQALVTLNDEQFIEAARLLAARVLAAGGDDATHIDAIARRVLARPFDADELPVVAHILDQVRERYRKTPDDASALIAVGETRSDPTLDRVELAALTMVCNQVLNLDEALCK